MKEPNEKRPILPSSPPKPSNDNEDSIFEPNSLRVKQSLLDLLNGESAKMTAALQNPANHERIIRAAKKAPAKIAELEKEAGMHAIFGPSGAVSEETVESMLGEKLPEEERDPSKLEMLSGVHIVPPGEIVIIEGVNEPAAPLPWWKRALNRILHYIGASVFLATPIPNMQLQKCTIRVEGQVMTIRCDSSQVCPAGWHLDTWWAYVPREDGELIQTMFGYGPAVKNSCKQGAGGVIFPAKDTQVLP